MAGCSIARILLGGTHFLKLEVFVRSHEVGHFTSDVRIALIKLRFMNSLEEFFFFFLGFSLDEQIKDVL